MKLKKQQAEMARWVLDPNATGAPEGLTPIKDLSKEGGATLYRESILEVEIRALKITFPIIFNLVGETYFREAAKRYLRATTPPPGDGNLDKIGHGFKVFLPSMEGADQTPYLADIATMELAFAAATDGADAAPLDASTLETLAADASKVSCRLCPNATLIRSEFPIDSIRDACLDGFKQELDISNDTGKASFIVWRPHDEPQISRLSDDEWTLLRAIQDNHLFLDAVEQAATAKPGIGIPQALPNAITNRWLEASTT